jgi:hypothetical protein
METAVTFAALGVAVVSLLAVVALALTVRGERRRTAQLLAHYRSELEERRTDPAPVATSVLPVAPAVAEFLITDAGAPEPEAAVRDRVVLSATLGEPLVRVVAFGHGLRRALSAESRNRIRFAMRREVRRARKSRRQEMREAWRRMRAEQLGDQLGDAV